MGFAKEETDELERREEHGRAQGANGSVHSHFPFIN